MDTLTLVLLIYFIVIQSIWLTALICHTATKADNLVEAMLFIAIAATVPYIGLFIAIEQFRKKRTQMRLEQMRKVNEETDDETDDETDEENINE